MAEILAIVLALSPVGLALLVALRLVARRRARWRVPPDLRRRPGNGGEPGSVREPRRPLCPAGAASAALPLPREPVEPGWPTGPIAIRDRLVVPERRAG